MTRPPAVPWEQDDGNKTLKQLREELLAGPGARAAYEEQAPEFAIARAILAARTGVDPEVATMLNRD